MSDVFVDLCPGGGYGELTDFVALHLLRRAGLIVCAAMHDHQRVIIVWVM